MNWSDDEIDKLFQESSSQLNVPYQESFWEEMETLLPAPQKSRRGIAWIWGGFMACILLIGTLFIPFKKIDTPSLGRVTAGKQLPGTPVHAMQASAAQHAVPLTQTQVESTSEKATVPTKPVHVGATTFATLQDATSPLNITVSTQPGQTSGQRLQAARPALAPNTAVALAAPVTPDFVAATESSVHEAENTAVSREPQSVAPETATATTDPVTDISGSESAATTVDNLQALPLRTFREPIAQTDLLPTTFDLLERNRHLYIQLGAGIAQSYISGTNHSSMMPTVAFGAGYLYDPKGWGFSAGLNFQSAFPANLEITQRSQIYGFGVTTYQQNLCYTQLYTVELPLNIQYRKGRHIFSAGLAPTFLAGTLMNLSRSENDEEQENLWYLGKKEGLKSWGLKPTLAYQLKVGKTTMIGMQLNLQTVSQIDPQQFSGKHTALPLSGQITIRRTLSK